MKKYLIILTSVIIIIPSVTFASWWNPISWFNNWSFSEIRLENKNQSIQDTIKIDSSISTKVIGTPMITVDIATSTIFSPTTTVDATEKKKVAPITSVPIINNPTYIPDVCLNIEGVQSVAPEGYSTVSNICTLKYVKDYCPNIEGTQLKVPMGLSLYKNTNQCLTETEIEKIEIENLINQKETSIITKKESSCQNSKDNMHNIQIRIQDVRDKYTTLISTARLNLQGAFGGAVERQVAQLQGQEDAELAPLESERYRINNDYIYYCN